MKHASRIFALLLAMMMVFALGATAYAADTKSYTITIDNEVKDYTYDAYQVFKGDLVETPDGNKTLSNVEWGAGVNGTAIAQAYASLKPAGQTEDLSAAQVAKLLSDGTIAATDFAAVVGKNLTTKAGTSTYDANNKKYNIPVTGSGYYFVKNSAVPTEDSEYTEYILQVVSNVSTKHKGDIPHVEKDILDPVPMKDNEAAIGEDVNYQLTASLPSNYEKYVDYFLRFNDTLSKGLTYKEGTLKVYAVNGTTEIDVTGQFDVNIGTYDATNGTEITVSSPDIKKLTGVTVDKDTKFVVRYTATLNQNALIVNPNDVDIDYSNDPNYDGGGIPWTDPNYPLGKTPKSTVKTYTTSIKLYKVDENGNPLTGAEFTLEGTNLHSLVIITEEKFVVDANGTYWKLKDGTYTTTAPTTDTESYYDSTTTKYSIKKETTTELKPSANSKISAEVGADGIVTFFGLGKGDYTLTETKTPAGYNTINPIDFKISYTSEADFTITSDDASFNETNETFEVTIENVKGSVLPSTGGIGTTVFTVGGVILMLGAGIVLVTRRRMRGTED